ncbi:hypothetical protein CJU89_4295 [Yarrowia sp. B02]|nr:hypothetical protein CJU89_4295 [Yarrowia sp. B02]
MMVSCARDWSSSSAITIAGGTPSLTELAKMLSETSLDTTPASIQKDGLSRVRGGIEGDYTLKSREGETIKVHKAVVAPLWPFFKGLLDSDMKEASENEAELKVPTSTLEVIVRYLYGQDLELSFPDAANLVVAAQMYDLPELLEIAIEKITKTTIDLTEAVMAWRLGFEAKNPVVRKHCAGKVKSLMPTSDNFAEQIDDLSKEELQYLLHDISVSMK